MKTGGAMKLTENVQFVSMRKCKLGSLMNVTRGASLSGEYYSSAGALKRLTLANFDYSRNCFKEDLGKNNLFYLGKVDPRFVLKSGDIITPLTEQTPGLLGTTAIVPEDGKYIQSQDVALIRPDKSVLDEDFAFYLVSSKTVRNQLGAQSQQTKIRHSSPDKIKDCWVFVPSLSVQKSIGSFLKCLDRKIALNRRKIATLEKMAKEIYEYSLKDHQNIEICKVSDIVNVRTGKMDANFATPLGKYPFFTCSDQVLRCDELAFRGSAVLLAGNGNFGVKFYDGEFNAYQRTYVLIPHNTDMFGTLYCAVKRVSEVLSSKSAGSIVKFITKGDVESINVPYHRTMGLKINACLKQILALEKSSSSLMELRDFLLPLLMNGQVKVGE